VFFRSHPAKSAGLLLVLGLAATAPFPLGGVLPAGAFRLELMAFLAAAAAAIGRNPRKALPRPAVAAATCLLGLVLLGLLQLLPLPAGVVRAVSPASAEVYSGAADVLAASGVVDAPPARISIAPVETRSVALLVAATAASFFAAAALLVTRNRRRGFAAVLLASMAVQAAWAVTSEQESGRVSGPYYNPDHFAGYLGIGLAVAFGAMVVALAGRPRERGPIHSAWLEKRIAAGAVGVLLWAFFASALALTHSRGGMLAAAATTLFLSGLALGARARREGGIASAQRLTLAAGLALGVLFVVAALGSRPLLRFLATDPRDLGADTRVLIWTHALEAWKSYPVFGSGLGTFREAFRVVQPRELFGLVSAAHGDFVHLLVTGGLVGALLGVGAWALVALHFLRGAILRIRHEEGAFALAGLGALVSIALHGLVEFNLSIPATSVTLALVAGAAVAAVRDAETMARSTVNESGGPGTRPLVARP
jgi:O-antigen ligase